jgi:hypothetical protein
VLSPELVLGHFPAPRSARRGPVLLDNPPSLVYNLTRYTGPGVLALGLLAEIAQLVEHATENRGVHSSILCLGTTCGRGSVVERLLAKEKAVGSNPIARSEDGAQNKLCAVSFCRRAARPPKAPERNTQRTRRRSRAQV